MHFTAKFTILLQSPLQSLLCLNREIFISKPTTHVDCLTLTVTTFYYMNYLFKVVHHNSTFNLKVL